MNIPVKVLEIAAVIVGAVLAYRIIHFLVRRYSKRRQEKTGLENRNKTINKLTDSIAKLVLAVVCILLCLKIAGFNIGSLMVTSGSFSPYPVLI